MHVSIHLLVANGGIDFMDVGGEGFEFDLLRILYEVRIGQVPALGYVQIFVRVHEQIEGARCLQKRQECDRRRDLPNDGADVFANVFDALFFGLGIEGDFFVQCQTAIAPTSRSSRCTL